MPAHPDLTRRALIPIDSPPSMDGRATVVRRFRLAHVPMYNRPDPAQDRFAHLRRTYD